MAIYVAKNGQLQTVKGIYYAMAEDYINATLFHNRVPKTATEIRFLYASNNPDLTGYQKIGYCDNNNFIEVWKNGTKYILINPRKNYIYAPVNCYIFLYDYTALISCNMENFNTVNVTIMYAMFSNCSSLTNLDVSSFNTQSVTTMYEMFSHCSSLTNLDVSSFNTANVTSMRGMFYNCNRLTSIISNTFNITNVETSIYMFTNCGSLVGGNGTTYNRSHVTAEYACVDGENGLPGYFTAPTN